MLLLTIQTEPLTKFAVHDLDCSLCVNFECLSNPKCSTVVHVVPTTGLLVNPLSVKKTWCRNDTWEYDKFPQIVRNYSSDTSEMTAFSPDIYYVTKFIAWLSASISWSVSSASLSTICTSSKFKPSSVPNKRTLYVLVTVHSTNLEFYN